TKNRPRRPLSFHKEVIFCIAFAIPAPIAAWMSTNWSFSAAVLVIVNFLITMAIYYPFFKVYEKQQLDKEAEELAAEQAAKN
ncbi:hypothetical protein ACM6QO_13500, partial [Enterococcus faecium]